MTFILCSYDTVRRLGAGIREGFFSCQERDTHSCMLYCLRVLMRDSVHEVWVCCTGTQEGTDRIVQSELFIQAV